MHEQINKHSVEAFQERLIAVLKSEDVRYWVENLDVSRSVVSHKWMKGTTLPKAELLWKILEIKDLSANWLFFGNEPKQMSKLVASGQAQSDDVSAAERFMKLFPDEVQEYIVQTVRLIPDPDSNESLPLLVNTMNVLIAYLQREKTQLAMKKAPVPEDAFELQWDQKGALTQCNSGMLNAFSLQADHVYGTDYRLPVDPKDSDRFNKLLAQLSTQTPSVHVRVRMEMPTGVSEWQEWDFEGKFDRAGQQTALIGRGNIVPQDRIRRR